MTGTTQLFPFTCISRSYSSPRSGSRYCTRLRNQLCSVSLFEGKYFKSQFKLSYLKTVAAIFAICLFSIFACIPEFPTIHFFGGGKSFRRSLQTEKWPDIVWLISFPNSGDGYTTHLVESISERTMATNYGTELGDKYHEISNHSKTPDGPFRYITRRGFPPHYILTKTHCTGYCLECGADMYILSSEQFMQGCATGHHLQQPGHGLEVARYNPNIVKKVVHLIRDPFDNIVARFHHKKHNKRNYASWDWGYSYGREGLLKWCAELDNAFTESKESWRDEDIAELATMIPCHGLFFQYVKFHNSVFDIVEMLGVPSHVIHYKDYRDNIAGAINDLFDFVRLPIVGTFNAFKFSGYSDYFTPEEKQAISAFLKVLSNHKTWEQLHQYLPSTQKDEKYEKIAEKLTPNKWPKLALLMSFTANEMTEITSIVRRISQTTTATNIGSEVHAVKATDPGFAYGENGPYRSFMLPFPKEYILTKSTCGAPCSTCFGNDFERSPPRFLQLCTSGVSHKDLERKITHYDSSEITKIVHVLRNPFENIVNRFHQDYRMMKNNQEWDFGYGPGGFKNWCNMIDGKFATGLPKKFNKAIAMSLPCYGQFYHYMRWHSNTMVAKTLLHKPSIDLYFEDLHSDDPELGMNALFDFIELDSIKSILPVQTPTYEHYFSRDEKIAAVSFMKNLCGPELCEKLERYFAEAEVDNWDEQLAKWGEHLIEFKTDALVEEFSPVSTEPDKPVVSPEELNESPRAFGIFDLPPYLRSIIESNPAPKMLPLPDGDESQTVMNYFNF